MWPTVHLSANFGIELLPLILTQAAFSIKAHLLFFRDVDVDQRVAASHDQWVTMVVLPQRLGLVAGLPKDRV